MRVRIDIPHAWHSAMTGTLIGTDERGEIATVLYWGYGRVTAPSCLVEPVDEDAE